MRSLIFGLGLALGAFIVVFGAMGSFAQGQEGAKDDEKTARLKERDRYGEETAKLRGEGRLKEAIEACKKMLAIEVEVLGRESEDAVGSLEQISDMHEDLEEFEAALKLRGEVLEIRKKVHCEKDWRVTDARIALEDIEKSSRRTGEERNLLREAWELSVKVVELWQKGRSKEALPLAEKALGIRDRILGKEHPDYATSLYSLARLYKDMADYARAEPLLKQSLDIMKKALGEEHPSYGTRLNTQASLYEDMGDHVRAEPLYKQALEIQKKVLGEEHPDYAASLSNLGTLYHAMGDYARAEPLCKQALEIHKKALGKEHPSYAASLNNQASLYEDMGDYARAEPLLMQSLEIKKKALGEGHPDYAASLNNLASLYRTVGDYARAEPLYMLTLEIWKKTLGEGHPNYGIGLNNLALLYYAMDDYARAEPLLMQSLEITKKALGEEHPGYAIGLSNLAGHYQDMGDYARSEPLQKQALEILKKALGEEHPKYALSLNNLAWLYQEMGDNARAEPLQKQDLEITKKALGEEHPDYARGLSNLAVLYHAMGNCPAGIPLLQQALGIDRKNLELASSIQSERQQIRMAETLRGALDAFLSLAPLAKVSGDESYREALSWNGAVFSRQRSLQLMRSRPDLLPLFSELDGVSRRLASLAFSVPEPKKREAWSRQIAELTDKKEDLEKKLSLQSAEFRREKARSRLEPREIQEVLPEDASLIDFLEYTLYSRPSDSATGPLKKEAHLLAFVLRRNEPVVQVDLGPLKPVEEAIDAWRQAIGAGEASAGAEKKPANSDESARELRRLLLDPLEKHLAGARLFLVSPDGALGRFPLGALPGKEAGKYLIEEVGLALVPFPRTLVDLFKGKTPPRERDGAPPSLLILGDVDYDSDPGSLPPKKDEASEIARAEVPEGAVREAPRGGGLFKFPRLEFTRGEMLAVGDTFESAFPGGRISKLRGEGATESAFREAAPRHRFLHLATHGFFAPPELKPALKGGEAKEDRGERDITGWHPGLLSGIVLSGANRGRQEVGGGEGDDGILTALELSAMDLRGADLLVFSACETGLGARAGGEGLLGLQRAAQVAGAGAVMASLWKVDDQDAMALMTRFYENLWKKGMGRLEALREAQLAILRGTLSRGPGAEKPRAEEKAYRAPPRAWAAWTLSGDYR